MLCPVTAKAQPRYISPAAFHIGSVLFLRQSENLIRERFDGRIISAKEMGYYSVMQRLEYISGMIKVARVIEAWFASAIAASG